MPVITAAVLGQDLLFTDDSYDIGKSGATRPRDLFLSRNLTVGGTTAVQALTASTVRLGGATAGTIGEGDTVIPQGRVFYSVNNAGTGVLPLLQMVGDELRVGREGAVIIGSGVGFGVSGGIATFSERADPSGVAGSGRVYVRDNGAGKTQLVVIFGTGAVQVLATEP